MNVNRVTPILNVADIQQSFAWFEKLGWKKGWDWDKNVREMHVRHPDGHVFRISCGIGESKK